MHIKDKRILVLGGTGLVGEEITKQLSNLGCEISLVSLGSKLDKKIFSNLTKYNKKLKHYTGNIFVPKKYKDKTFNELLSSEVFLDDYLNLVYSDTNYKSLFLYDIVKRTKPNIVIDAVNSATVLSYTKNLDLIKDFLKGDILKQKAFLATISTPRLIKFFQSLYKALIDVDSVNTYIKIGTTGTGGMGFNIPYTHGENKPSIQLLEKAAVSGAFTGLLYTLSQSFSSKKIKEIKPATLVGFREVNFGYISLARGVSQKLKKFKLDHVKKVDLNSVKEIKFDENNPKEDLRVVYVDTGENGQFSLEEFRTISNSRQMGLITKEEITKTVLKEIHSNSGKDVIEAYKKSVLNPTTFGQKTRKKIVEEMERLVRENKTPSLAFEVLGPPRLSKLIFEAYLLNENRKIKDKGDIDSEDVSLIVSTGIPILLPNNNLLLGKKPKIPENEALVSKEDIDKWAEVGWVDLRAKNIKKWKERFKKFGGSQKNIKIGNIVAWIFENEDGGFRKY